jgi:hypothetical protein
MNISMTGQEKGATCLSATNKCHLFVSDKKDDSCWSATIVMCHLLVGD